jgi:hypothetical protein
MGESESGSEEGRELDNLGRVCGGTDEPHFDGGRGSARNPRMSRPSGDEHLCYALRPCCVVFAAPSAFAVEPSTFACWLGLCLPLSARGTDSSSLKSQVPLMTVLLFLSFFHFDLSLPNLGRRRMEQDTRTEQPAQSTIFGSTLSSYRA